MIIKCTEAERDYIVEEHCCWELRKELFNIAQQTNCKLLGCLNCYEKNGIKFDIIKEEKGERYGIKNIYIPTNEGLNEEGN